MSRDQTVLFEKFRRSYKATTIPIPPAKAIFENEVYEGVASSDLDIMELQSFSPVVSGVVRDWLYKKERLERFLKDIINSIERLKSEHDRKRLPTIEWKSDSKSSNNEMVHHLFKQITGMFGVAQGKIDELSTLQMGMTTSEWRQMKNNIKIAMRNGLARHAEYLRQVEIEAATQKIRMATTVHLKKFASPEILSDPSNMFVENQWEQVIREDPSKQIQLEERDKDFELMSESMFQVVELLRSMQTLVTHQGSLVDRIDFNLERGQRYVRRANDQLSTSVKTQQISQTRKVVLLFLMLLIFVLFIAIFAHNGHHG